MTARLTNAHLLTKVLTATNREVIVYLYEGAIGYLHRAICALREGRPKAAATSIERVVNIIIELSGNLNYTLGGQIALRLDAIYSHLVESLTLADARGDVEALESCMRILVILCDAWRQALGSDPRHHPGQSDRRARVPA
ncbi:MAG: flagellar export chaperone FliS [bacterium]|nr:flagellar export chaperone FliS [bacterium]